MFVIRDKTTGAYCHGNWNDRIVFYTPYFRPLDLAKKYKKDTSAQRAIRNINFHSDSMDNRIRAINNHIEHWLGTSGGLQAYTDHCRRIGIDGNLLEYIQNLPVWTPDLEYVPLDKCESNPV